MVFTRKPEPKSLKIAPPSLTPELQQASAAPNGPEAFGTHAVEDGSMIGNDLSIEGDSITMRCKGTLRVNGSIEANLHCQNLLVGDHAVIVGSITAARIAVSGRVNGAIYGDSVVLHPTGAGRRRHTQPLPDDRGWCQVRWPFTQSHGPQ
jgi:hypothetical protein